MIHLLMSIWIGELVSKLFDNFQSVWFEVQFWIENSEKWTQSFTRIIWIPFFIWAGRYKTSFLRKSGTHFPSVLKLNVWKIRALLKRANVQLWSHCNSKKYCFGKDCDFLIQRLALPTPWLHTCHLTFPYLCAYCLYTWWLSPLRRFEVIFLSLIWSHSVLKLVESYLNFLGNFAINWTFCLSNFFGPLFRIRNARWEPSRVNDIIPRIWTRQNACWQTQWIGHFSYKDLSFVRFQHTQFVYGISVGEISKTINAFKTNLR